MSTETFQRFQCQKCVWYLTLLDNADSSVDQIIKTELPNAERYKEFELKVDTEQWSHNSEKINSLQQMLREARRIYDSIETDKEGKTLISFRLFFNTPYCKTMAINPARHRCKVCTHNFVPIDNAVWQPLPDVNKLIFACATPSQIIENARQAQNHLSRLAHYQGGDGTFFAATSIIKPLDAPNQSLLKQAIRVGRGEKADGSDSPSPAVLRPQNQIFTTNRYALVPRGAVPKTNDTVVIDKRLRQDNARPYNCSEDEYDVDLRQMGDWYEQHFSGRLSREDYFLATAQMKGVSKFDIVAAFNE